MATETTVTSAKAWALDQPSTYSPDDAVPDALILQTSTISGEVDGDQPVVRVPYVDDADAGFIAEGAEIPEADPGLDEVAIATGKVSQLVRLSREQFGRENASTLIMSSVRRAVTTAANRAYIAQPAPVAPAITPPAGLLNIDGISEVTGLVVGALDPLIDLIAEIQDAGGNPTHIVTSPTGWAELLKLKAADGSHESLLGAGTDNAERRLLDLPVLVSSAVPPGGGLVIDQTAIVSAVGDVQVATSDQAYFSSDSIGVRCTWRFGANVVHPERIGRFTVDAGATSTSPNLA